MISEMVDVMRSSQRANLDFFRGGNWLQTLLSPEKHIDHWQNKQQFFDDIEDSVASNHEAIVSEIPMKATKIGFSPDEIQMIETREMNKIDGATAYGISAGMVNAASYNSYASKYLADSSFRMNTATPIGHEICAGLSLHCHPNWEVWLDTSEYMRGDPRTQLELLAIENKNGWISANAARLLLGRDTEGDLTDPEDPNNMSMVDGNRVPIDLIPDMIKAKSMAGKQAPERPPVPGTEQKTPDYPDVPSSRNGSYRFSPYVS